MGYGLTLTQSNICRFAKTFGRIKLNERFRSVGNKFAECFSTHKYY